MKREVALQHNAHLRNTFVKPIFVWEPIEGSCRTSELSLLYEAMQVVDVFSPNEHELGLLFNTSTREINEPTPTELLHTRCRTLLIMGFGDRPSAVVIRRGEFGCLVASHDRITNFPAYHTPPMNSTSEEALAWYASKTANWDVTGGGNAFLGGFCAGLLYRPNDQIDNLGFTDFEHAAIYGSVAASFAIEQISMPKLSQSLSGKELWNGECKSSSTKFLKVLERLLSGFAPFLGFCSFYSISKRGVKEVSIQERCLLIWSVDSRRRPLEEDERYMYQPRTSFNA